MDEKIQEILKMIIKELKIKMYIKSVSDVAHENLRDSLVGSCDLYNDYKIYEFLALYKVKYLEENKMIEKDLADKFNKLIIKKIEIFKELSNILAKEVYNKKLSLEEKQKKEFFTKNLIEIEEILAKYKLLINEKEIIDLFINNIKGFECLDKDVDKISVLIKK